MKDKTPFGILIEKIKYIGKNTKKLAKPMWRKLWDVEEEKWETM